MDWSYNKSEEHFYKYFAINDTDKEMGIGASNFDKDLGTDWYDDDLIGIFYKEEVEEYPFNDVINEIYGTAETLREILRECKKIGIQKANSMFYYADPELVVKDHAKKYNGINYLGCFNVE